MLPKHGLQACAEWGWQHSRALQSKDHKAASQESKGESRWSAQLPLPPSQDHLSSWSLKVRAMSCGVSYYYPEAQLPLTRAILFEDVPLQGSDWGHSSLKEANQSVAERADWLSKTNPELNTDAEGIIQSRDLVTLVAKIKHSDLSSVKNQFHPSPSWRVTIIPLSWKFLHALQSQKDWWQQLIKNSSSPLASTCRPRILHPSDTWDYWDELRIAPFSLGEGCCSTFCWFKVTLTHKR